PDLDRRAVVRAGTIDLSGAQTFTARRGARVRDRTQGGFRECFPGPDPRRGKADAGAGRARRGGGGGARPGTYLVLRADAGRARRGSADGESRATGRADA